MDVRARFTFLILLVTLLSACGEPDKAETIIPEKTETCGGSALQESYIVHFKNGSLDYVANSDRKNFKENYVRPQLEAIDFIEYDQKISVSDVPAHAELAPAVGIDNWGAAAIHADKAWERSWLGQDIVIAILDTGVDITHTQLSTQVYFNDGESGDKKNNGLDDDLNGYIDDYAGYNFYDNNGDVTDLAGHGTHVAGVIAARHSDTTVKPGYVQGVAPAAKVLPIKFLGTDGGSLSSALRGIDYAAARGAKIINASCGGPGCSQSLQQKMVEVAAKNIFMIVAAGNNGVSLDQEPEYPAAFNSPLQITVGALTDLLNMAYYSNYSRNLVHLFAPGSNIVSTTPDNNYASLSGTSMATPFVAGAVALVMSAYPKWSLDRIRSELFSAAETDNNYVNVTRGRLSLSKLTNASGL